MVRLWVFDAAQSITEHGSYDGRSEVLCSNTWTLMTSISSCHNIECYFFSKLWNKDSLCILYVDFMSVFKGSSRRNKNKISNWQMMPGTYVTCDWQHIEFVKNETYKSNKIAKKLETCRIDNRSTGLSKKLIHYQFLSASVWFITCTSFFQFSTNSFKSPFFSFIL